MASAERREVMHRLHEFLLRQSNTPERPRTAEACAEEHTPAEGSRPQTSSPTAQQSTSLPAAAQHTPAQRRITDSMTTIETCMKWLDRLIVVAFSVLAVLIAWNVLK